MSGGTPTVSTHETRILSLRVQQSSYGLTVPVVYGRTRIAGNLIWYGDFKTYAHTTTTYNQSGKGGGDVAQEHTHYSYTAALALALCEGPIRQVVSIWKNKSHFKVSPLSTLNLLLKAGTLGQDSTGYLTTFHPQAALGYSQTAYLFSPAYGLSSDASAGNHNVEIDAQCGYSDTMVDANPKDILQDLLTNNRYGVGFVSEHLGDLSTYSIYCRAMGIFLSPAFTEQQEAHQVLAELATMTNAAYIWSEGKLKVIPYGDSPVSGQDATYVPDRTPLYDLTESDFVVSGGSDPLVADRKTPADAFNHVQIEYQDRDNAYNIAIAEAKDQGNIATFGLRSQTPITMHAICQTTIAQTVAQLIMQRALYIRNTYEFHLGWQYALLEPMDIVTLTDTAMGLHRQAVRITSIDENEAGLLTVQAEDCPLGVASAALYPCQSNQGYATNYNVDPDVITDPFIFEMPNLSAAAQVRLNIAVSGQNEHWGGCWVYTSLDGETYQPSGLIKGTAQYGQLTAPLDENQQLSVQLAGQGGILGSFTPDAAQHFQSVCYVDGEYIGYEQATLRDKNSYCLTGLLRGLYATHEVDHAAGKWFVCIDKSLFTSEPIEESLIGHTLYFKFVSLNVFGFQGSQSLAQAVAYPYQVKGFGFTGTLPMVPNLASYFQADHLVLTWGVITDARLLDYEVRKGPSWVSAIVVGRTTSNTWPVSGDGHYWVSARSAKFYSSAPASIAITGSSHLTKNVVVQESWVHPNWPAGILGLGVFAHNEGIALSGDGLFSSMALVSAITSICFYGKVMPLGTVEIQSAVDMGSVQDCHVSIDGVFQALHVPSSAQITSVDGASDLATQCGVTLEMATDETNPDPTQWQAFVAGTYRFRYLKWRAHLSSKVATVTPLIQSIVMTVDMPDRFERGTHSTTTLNDGSSDNLAMPIDPIVMTAGTTITFGKPFTRTPNVQISIMDGSTNDKAVLTGVTTEQFTLTIYNPESSLVRTFGWVAQGF